jgi:hypothetical protein
MQRPKEKQTPKETRSYKTVARNNTTTTTTGGSAAIGTVNLHPKKYK